MKKLKFSLLLTAALTLTTALMPVQKASAADSPQPPTIVGKAGITIDLKTGEIIYANGIDNRAYPASTTKLMTAILFAENKKKTDIIPYNEDARKQPEYALRVNFFPNIKDTDTMTADDVMKAMLVFSANDSAYMVADSVAGSSDNFIKMMNDKAKSFGLKDTNFVTANGLHDPNHYTTAYDLGVIGKNAFQIPWIRETIALKNAKVTLSNGLWASIDNRNKLLGLKGCLGGKTGWTSQAGRCLVALYERDGRDMVGVVLNSEYGQDTQVFKDMESIIDWSYAAKRVVKTQANSQVKTVDVSYKPLKFFGPTKTIKVPLVVKEDVAYYDNEVNDKETTMNVKANDINVWKLASGTQVGTLDLKERDYSKSYPLYTNITKGDLMSQNKGLYILTGVAGVAILAVLIALITFILKHGRRNKRRRSSYY